MDFGLILSYSLHQRDVFLSELTPKLRQKHRVWLCPELLRRKHELSRVLEKHIHLRVSVEHLEQA